MVMLAVWLAYECGVTLMLKLLWCSFYLWVKAYPRVAIIEVGVVSLRAGFT